MDIYEDFINHVRTSQILNFYMRYQNRNFESYYSIYRDKHDKILRIYYPILYYSKTPNILLENLLSVIFDISTHFAFPLDPDKLNYNYNVDSNFLKNMKKIKSKKIVNETKLSDFKTNPNRNYKFKSVDSGFQKIKAELQNKLGREPTNVSLQFIKTELNDGSVGEQDLLQLSLEKEMKINKHADDIYEKIIPTLKLNIDENEIKKEIIYSIKSENITDAEKNVMASMSFKKMRVMENDTNTVDHKNTVDDKNNIENNIEMNENDNSEAKKT